MERSLDKVLTDLCRTPGVTGALCADTQGLCLTSKGNAMAKSAGIFASMAHLASQLEPNNAPPIIYLESDNCNIMVQKKNDITLAIYKSPTKDV